MADSALSVRDHISSLPLSSAVMAAISTTDASPVPKMTSFTAISLIATRSAELATAMTDPSSTLPHGRSSETELTSPTVSVSDTEVVLDASLM